ncbi:MAG: PEGA domain-containing protein [Vicinamibacterales bacterium]
MGRRVLAFDRETGAMLECLVLRPELSAFEAALRERLPVVAGLEDERFAQPRGVDRGADDRLTVTSENVAGRRLSDVLDAAAEHGIVAGLDAGLGLLLELLPALALLHDAGLAHGALAPGRIMITPAGQLVMLDAVYAEPLERLKLTRRRLWSEFRLAFPSSAGGARFDKAADLGHATMTAAALSVGRPLREDDYPDGLPGLRQEIVEIASIRGSKGFAEGVDRFLAGTMPLAGRRGTLITSSDEAAIELRKLVRKELGINTCRTALLEFFQQVESADAERIALDAAQQVAPGRAETERSEAEQTRERGDAQRRDKTRKPDDAERGAAERGEALRLDEERLERERVEHSRLEAERVEHARLEAQRLEEERLEHERVEHARLEAERFEDERLEHERVEKARLGAQRLEEERLEGERVEQARLEAERLEKERLEAERLEKDRLEQARLEAKRLDEERLERERLENARLEAERLEKERLEKARLEAKRLDEERLERERLEKVRLEEERLEHERLEQARLEADRLEKERLEKARLAAERRERERAAEKARLEAERLERERAEEARLEAERLERERKETERREQVARERGEKARREKERVEKARAEAARLEQERLDAERRERELLEAARADRDRAEKARLEAERIEEERAELARREAEREEQEEERERAERARVEAERLEAAQRKRQRDREEAVAGERAEQEALERAEQESQQEAAASIAASAPAVIAAPAPVPIAASAPVAAPPPAVAAAPSGGWLVSPDRAAKFDHVFREAPPTAAPRAYPIYVPPSEPSAWTPRAPEPLSPEVEPVAGADPAPSISFGASGSPSAGGGEIRFKEEPGSHTSHRIDGRHEPEPGEMSAEGAYEPFGPHSDARPVPWRLIAAGAILIGAAVAISWGYAPSSVPLLKTVATTAPPFAAPEPAPVPAGSARLAITTQPAGARVTIDGKAAGETPLTLDTITPGRHVVIVTAPSGASARRTVRVESGKTVAIDLPLFSGFAAISAPFEIQVAENGKSLGTSSEQILLSPGRHELRVSNKNLSYVATEAVEIQAGEVTRVTLDPRGRANINAAPWAEVFIDGEKAGETPLANVAIRLGTREIVFKNPQFGERKVTATITAGAPATISVDFIK